MSSTAGYLVETFVTLLAVVAVAVAVLVSAKRLGLGAPSGPIELVGRLPLDARRAVYLVRVGTQVLVLGSSEAGITKLGELPHADLPPAPRREPATFADVLKRLGGGKPRA